MTRQSILKDDSSVDDGYAGQACVWRSHPVTHSGAAMPMQSTVRQVRMSHVSVRQPKLGFGNIPVMDLMAGGGMMADDVLTCLRVGVHGGRKKRGCGDQQNMLHFTLHSLLKSGRRDRRPRSNRAE
jgi:hypothetical protein